MLTIKSDIKRKAAKKLKDCPDVLLQRSWRPLCFQSFSLLPLNSYGEPRVGH